MSRCVVFLTLVAWVGVATVSAQFSCPAPPGLVCDPSLETGDHLSSAHCPAPEQCQAACSLGHSPTPASSSHGCREWILAGKMNKKRESHAVSTINFEDVRYYCPI